MKKIFKQNLYIFSIGSGFTLGAIVLYSLFMLFAYEFGLIKHWYEVHDLISKVALVFTILWCVISLGIAGLISLFVSHYSKKQTMGIDIGIYEKIMNSMIVSLVVFDKYGNISIENPGFQKSFNPWSKKGIKEVLPLEIIDDIHDCKESFEREVELFDNENEKRIHYTLSCTSFIYSFEGESVKKHILILKNDEEKIQKDKIIKQQMAIAQSSGRLESLASMATGFAHEINNPLSVIAATNLILKKRIDKLGLESEDDSKFKKLTSSIDQTILRITKVIKGLRSLAREGDRDTYELVKLKDFIDEFTVLAKVKLYSTGMNLLIDLGDSEKVEVEMKKVELTQVFMNLVNNASDAIKDLDEKWIKIYTVDNGNFIDIMIEDSGNGIEKGLEEKIFQPMFTTKDFGKGIGLGLSTSHSIIERHGGKLSLDVKNEHTCFVISYPKKSNNYKAA